MLRTLFLLRYISEPHLREQITASTNKVESYHRLAQWCPFGGEEGALLGDDPEELEKTLKYNQVLTTAVLIQNVVDQTRVVRDLKADGYPVTPEGVAFLSPYLTRHIRRFGDYVIDLEGAPLPEDGDSALVL